MSALAIGGAMLLVKISGLILLTMVADRLLLRNIEARSRVDAQLPLLFISLPIVTMVTPAWAAPVMRLQHALVESPMTALAPRVSWSAVLLGVWLSIAAFQLIRFVVSWRTARVIADAAVRVSDTRIDAVVSRAASGVNYTRALPAIVITGAVQSPSVMGVRRPVVLLPTAAIGWADVELYGVLCHELSHLERRDWLTYVLEELVAAIYWPTPFVRMLWRRTALRRELAADQAAMRAGASPSIYASRLIAVARDCTRGPVVAGLAFGTSRRNDLSVRVKALFNTTDGLRPAPRWIVSSLIAFASVVIAAAQPVECVATAPSPPSESCPR